ncbi:hypothetical protein lotta81_gp001 [Flavobacterium phage vB_FspM_lotta8-1]|uniref:Uncharacterized protein n=3 Tax=Pippivirus TaxID=2843435 RepID=A0A6B9LL66_9CAUD|nr:hypothetical protein HWC85_gp01 [Flavobacterium phage vB_FspM_lotta8-1]YP_009854532.1 hypothetical protein HWC86_gp01 [Flavobacterium phage vB_FspM_pippi8-1]QHB38459.1 hypothetical protein lotta81_gp001 [Flavobacterium phage vB_FspM_lotta8-1]QHB38512.1 hypothetical protein lotta82_gp001 [Flavobacterium phage vB_FspM_lotta8-2]QHB38565.1 hypothetical protein pippi81_gp001 [Flavobacterium phage vB_FspM_pippi8-1]
MKKTKQLDEELVSLLLEYEAQRSNFVRFLPFCGTLEGKIKLLTEIHRLNEEISVLINLITYE